MTSIRFFLVMLNIIGLLTFYTAVEGGKLDAMQGAYLGQVMNGDDLDPVHTEIGVNDVGSLIGSYKINDETGDSSGVLFNFIDEGCNVTVCTWKDQHGTGALRMHFSDDLSRFRGYWGVDRKSTVYPWTGVRGETDLNKAISQFEITNSTIFSQLDEPLDEISLKQLAQELGRRQADSAIGAKVEVVSAFPYLGKTWVEPVEGARLIAVELVVYDHGDALDFDDFEIINGMTKVSYGSDPDIKFLNMKKQEVEWSPTSSGEPGRAHVLLIYAFPEEQDNFGLRYWGLDFESEKLVIQRNQSHLLNVGMHFSAE
ncbi:MULTISPECIES: hypothetical protein [unclassified Lentimonas]|nr:MULTISPECIES: hypothetical protein [unclassified Lentimonas]